MMMLIQIFLMLVLFQM